MEKEKRQVRKMLKNTAGVWIFGCTLTPVLSWAILDELGLSKDILLIIFAAGAFISALIFSLSFFIKPTLYIKSPKTLFFALFFALFPLALPFVFMGTIYFFLISTLSTIDLMIKIITWGIVFVWSGLQLRNYQKRIINRHFIEREFLIFYDKIFFRQPQKTNLDAHPITHETSFGRVYNKYGSYLLFAALLAYPLQILILIAVVLWEWLSS
jgi:hypothetical protein